jgi:hypothetical protein
MSDEGLRHFRIINGGITIDSALCNNKLCDTDKDAHKENIT